MLPLSEFASRYHLSDRTLTRAAVEGEFIVVDFDLYHCDDPGRSQDGYAYPLRVRFPVAETEVLSFQPLNDPAFGGEVVRAEMIGASYSFLAFLPDEPFGSKSIELVVTAPAVQVSEDPPRRWQQAS